MVLGLECLEIFASFMPWRSGLRTGYSKRRFMPGGRCHDLAAVDAYSSDETCPSSGQPSILNARTLRSTEYGYAIGSYYSVANLVIQADGSI